MSRGGRGRGRGRGYSKSGIIDALSLAPGEQLPPPILTPPPPYPHLERKPLDLKLTDEDEYLISVKQELRACMGHSPFYLRQCRKKNVVLSYTALKNQPEQKGLFQEWKPDWSLFPNELFPVVRKKTRSVTRRSPMYRSKLDIYKA